MCADGSLAAPRRHDTPTISRAAVRLDTIWWRTDGNGEEVRGCGKRCGPDPCRTRIANLSDLLWRKPKRGCSEEPLAPVPSESLDQFVHKVRSRRRSSTPRCGGSRRPSRAGVGRRARAPGSVPGRIFQLRRVREWSFHFWFALADTLMQERQRADGTVSGRQL